MEKKETGILFLSLSKLQLCLAGVEGTSLNLRVDVALDLANTSTGGDISWNNPNTKEPNKFSTGVKAVSKRTGPQMVSASELVESEVLADLPDIFHLDLERLSRRTNFFALNKENLTLLSNSSLKMTVVAVVPSLTAKVVKGQEPPTVSEPWVEISIPLSALVISHGFQMASSIHFEEVLPNVEMKLLKTGLIAKDSFLHWTLSGDNELCEFCLGCSLFRIESASVIPPIPSPWTIVIPDIADGKSKGPPNDAAKAAIRAKYIENVTKACANSSSLYSLKIGGQGDGASYLDYLASHTLSNALASFNSTAAAAVSVQEDIRLCTDLWSIAWSGSSQYTFLHRTELKRLAFALFIGPVNLPVSLNKKASPSLLDPKSKDKEPKGPVDISMNVAGQLSLSEFSTPGLRESTATVSLTTDTVDGADITLQMLMRFTSNPTPASVVGKSDPTLTVPDTLSSKRVVTPVQQVDPLQELRDEISAVVKYVAREYVTLYPLSPGDDATEDGFNLNTRKSDFFHFLSSTG